MVQIESFKNITFLIQLSFHIQKTLFLIFPIVLISFEKKGKLFPYYLLKNIHKTYISYQLHYQF